MEKDDSEDFPIIIAIAVVAGLLVVIILLVCIIVCCCCMVYRKNKHNPPERIGSRRYLIRNSKRATKKGKGDVEDSVDATPLDTTDNTQTATKTIANDYVELLESITDKDAHEYTKLQHQTNGSMTKPTSDTNGDTRNASSGSPCSVTSTDAATNIDPVLATSEQASSSTTTKVQATDLPSQEVPEYVNVSNQSAPKKESQRSWFNFRSKKKSKKPKVENVNPLFNRNEAEKEQVECVDVSVTTAETTDHTMEGSSSTDAVREASKDQPDYTNVTKTTADIEEPSYGNIASVRNEQISQETAVNGSSNPQLTMVNSVREASKDQPDYINVTKTTTDIKEPSYGNTASVRDEQNSQGIAINSSSNPWLTTVNSNQENA